MADVSINIKVNARGAEQQVARISGSAKKAEKNFKSLNVSLKSTTSAFKVFAGNIASIGISKLTSSLVSFGQGALDTTKQLETLTTQFEVLTGSAGAANAAVADLQKFAASTPFKFPELAKSAQRLLSFGFSLEEVNENLVDLGDVAAASGSDLGELSLIFGQVRAAGKLTGERLLQLQERAIPIGPAIAESMGVTEEAVRDLVTQGKVDFATFEEAFKSLNEEGQFAFEGLEKRSRTLEGRLSTLSDNFDLLTTDIGQKLAPAFKAIVSTITVFIQRIRESAAFDRFLETIGNAIPDAISFAVDAFGFVIDSVLNVVKIFNLFRSGVTTALSVVIGAFTKFIDIYAKVINALGLGDTALGRSINSVNNFRTDVIDSLDQTAAGFAKNAAEIDASQEKVNQSIKDGKDFLLKTYDEEIAAAEAQANAVVENNEKKIASEQRLTQAQLDEINKRREAEKKLREELTLAESKLAIQKEANRLVEVEQEQIFTDERLLRLEDSFTREEQAQIQAALNAEQNAIKKEIMLTKAVTDGEKKRIAVKKKAAQEEAKIQQLTLSKTSQFFGAASRLAAAGGKKNFKIAQALSVAQTIINGIQQVSEAAKLPWPANIPATAFAIADSAARIATIKSQQAPSFETGGIVPGTSFTGDSVNARVNSGEMILNRQQQNNLFRIAQTGAAGGGAQEIVIQNRIELDGDVVAESVSRSVANGLVLGEVQ